MAIGSKTVRSLNPWEALDWTMTKEKKREEQSNTKLINAVTMVKGEKSLEDLPEPYLLLWDCGSGDNMAKAINILTIKKGYKVASYAEVVVRVVAVCMHGEGR